MKELNIIEADLSNKKHTDAILHVTNEYAKHPMGLGKPLPEDIREKLIDEIQNFPVWFSLIALYDDQPAGIVNCVYSFSTFNAAKVINIHDLAVLKN
ncbi:MAG: GNAT family N-acetyltransferase, partial [Bacteroidetes bacterium]|nr:GNAT family N-acetyltransferase [Bacteroidota bacterium]